MNPRPCTKLEAFIKSKGRMPARNPVPETRHDRRKYLPQVSRNMRNGTTMTDELNFSNIEIPTTNPMRKYFQRSAPLKTTDIQSAMKRSLRQSASDTGPMSWRFSKTTDASVRTIIPKTTADHIDIESATS